MILQFDVLTDRSKTNNKMREELNNPAGLYSPTFFRMHVKTKDDLTNPNLFSQEVSATYFHEYIHFLQDISTTYGFINISRVVNYIKYVADFANSNGLLEIKTPIIPESRQGHFVSENIELWKKYEGDTNHIKGGRITVLNAKLNPVDVSGKKVNQLIAKIDNSGMKSDYLIGAHAISESMAYEAEQILYPNVLPEPPPLPYLAVRKLVESYSAKFPKDPLWIIGLCDVSLMSFNPGELMLRILDKVNNEELELIDPNSLYKLLNEEIHYEGCSNYTELHEKMSKAALKDIQDYFTTETFKDNNEWLESVFSKSLMLRTKIPNFILDICRMGEMKENVCFAGTMYMIGTPLVVNSENQATFFHPLINQNKKIDPSFLWAINQMFKSFVRPISQRYPHCEMIQWCQKSSKEQGIEDYTNSRCSENPWTKVKADDPGCVYAQLWKTWGLKEVDLK